MTDNYIIASAERQAQLEAAKAAFFMSGGQAKICPSPPERVLLPVRKAWVDPETVLKRKCNQLTRRQREKLRAMADAL